MRGECIGGLSVFDQHGIHSPCSGKCERRRYDCHFEGHCKEWDEYQAKRAEFIKSDKYQEALAKNRIKLDWRFNRV